MYFLYFLSKLNECSNSSLVRPRMSVMYSGLKEHSQPHLCRSNQQRQSEWVMSSIMDFPTCVRIHSGKSVNFTPCEITNTCVDAAAQTHIYEKLCTRAERQQESVAFPGWRKQAFSGRIFQTTIALYLLQYWPKQHLLLTAQTICAVWEKSQFHREVGAFDIHREIFLDCLCLLFPVRLSQLR